MAGLNDFTKKLERLAAGEVERVMLRSLPNVVVEQTVSGFNGQRDPYGAAWAPRKSGGSWPLLDKSGSAINSLQARVVGKSVRATMLPYMKFHQTGTSAMAQRMVFPDPARGLGLWTDPLHRTAINAVKEAVK